MRSDDAMVLPESKKTRRQAYADQTREAIVGSARSLFAEKGYAATTVEEIARRANVAGITVYTTVGGKSGLLRHLMDIWSTAPVVENTLEEIHALGNGGDVVLAVARVSRAMREQFGDIIYVMLNAAPNDAEVAASLRIATERYQASFVTVAEHLRKLEALQEGLNVATAAEILWFYFGYSSYRTLHDENGWSYDQAEAWLAGAARRALLETLG